ncbi:unnamed protein product [Porites lobata]|uniref:Uncharacterized protein n=1 Tax=Porites lobata TaxID=104759 RepID=A0ABN8ND71_9CNID|nr:unnamed protein product [Porites lobata]
MTTYFEYGVKLTDGQKSKLASAIRNKSPLTLRLKHSHLQGSDELMLTQRQITKIKKSLRNGTGSDIKISKTQIRKSVKHGGNLFSSLASIGAKVLPYALKGISKAVPALATGAATALGEIGLNKIFGKGITIPKKFFPMLPAIRGELTKSQIDLINKIYQSGGRLVIKPTRKQIEGGFLGTLASIGIPMAISLVSKMFGGGLQVDRRGSSNTANVYVPHPPPSTHGEGYPYHFPPPFIGSWENPIGMGVKKKKSKSKGKGIYSRDGLPHKIRKECGIINLDDMTGPGTHWVCYRNIDNIVEYFDPFGLIMPNEALAYFHTSGKRIFYSMDEIQNRNTVLCGYWCLYYLFERQRGTSILDVIHNPHFDNDNSDFIKEYFGG